MEELESIKQQIIEKYKPVAIYLFGSQAQGRARPDSDIDLCIIMNYQDKRKTRIEMSLTIEAEKDIDFILYTPEEWDAYTKDTGTFANLILRTGVKIYG